MINPIIWRRVVNKMSTKSLTNLDGHGDSFYCFEGGRLDELAVLVFY